MPILHNAITDVESITVGHTQDEKALTGCTVILCEKGATAGVDVRGGAPGTRETDTLRPMHLVEHVHAVILAGGSAYGLDAATGVMRFLEEKGAGFNTGVARVPIVASAILFDLAIGNPRVRPDAAMGYQACLNASAAAPPQGNVGAGCGATVGKILGMNQAMKSGIGSASIEIGSGVVVGAIVAVNAFGDVIDPSTNSIIAGARPLRAGRIKFGASEKFADTLNIMRTFIGKKSMQFAVRSNTVVGVVATNARLTKEESNLVAKMAQNGIAMTVRPAHTLLDGDTLFCMATNKRKADVNIVGAFAAHITAEAILRAIWAAKPAAGLPAASTYVG